MHIYSRRELIFECGSSPQMYADLNEIQMSQREEVETLSMWSATRKAFTLWTSLTLYKFLSVNIALHY